MVNESKAVRSRDDRIFDALVYTIAGIVLLLVLYPLLFVVSASFSDPISVIDGKVWSLPQGFTFTPYLHVFENESIWSGFRNTILYTLIGTFVNIILTILAAYPLSQRDLPGRTALMFIITITMFFSGGLIPTYLLIKSLGMINTVWAMIIPGAISTYNLIVMRTFFRMAYPTSFRNRPGSMGHLIFGCC